jgi:hypothetical protein
MRVGDLGRDNGGGPLQQYRLYFLDGAGRITSSPHNIEADGDETAVRLAEAWREGRSMELWCGERRVQVWGYASER